jgi:hypothetical protein
VRASIRLADKGIFCGLWAVTGSGIIIVFGPFRLASAQLYRRYESLRWLHFKTLKVGAASGTQTATSGCKWWTGVCLRFFTEYNFCSESK